MKFYEIQELKVDVYKDSGISAMLMCSILEDIDAKYSNFPDIMQASIVVLHEGSFAPESVMAHGKVSKRGMPVKYAIVDPAQEFIITDKSDMKFYGVIQNSQIIMNINPNENLKVVPPSLTPDESIAWDWLEYGKVGASSKTLCAYLFPKLVEMHNDLGDIGKPRDSYPFDIYDFNRCENFLKLFDNSVRERAIGIGSKSPVWTNLFTNWDTIKNEADEKAASDLVRNCDPSRTNKFKP